MASIETAISFPFTLDDNGNVARTVDQNKIWADRVRIAIGTRVGERVMRTDFGSKIARGLFDTITSMETLVREDLSSVFATQFPILKLGEIETSFDETTNYLTVTVTYSLPNKTTISSTAVVGTVSLSGNRQPYEVISS
jgi:phage baseplate assembly protein W